MDHGRFYQREAVDAVYAEWQTARESLLNMATGAGKTVIFAEVAKRWKHGRVLILAERRELVRNAKAEVEKWAGLDCEIEMGEYRAEVDLLRKSHVIVSSIQSQTLGRRMKPEFFSLVIVDEAHHLCDQNKSYMNVRNHYMQNPETKFLYVTATPSSGLLKVLQKITYNYPILSGVDDGFLCSIRPLTVRIENLDYSHCRTTAGDLNGADREAVVMREGVPQSMCMASLEVMYGVPKYSLRDLEVEQWATFLNMNGTPKRNLVFCAGVDQAEIMANIFNRVQPGLAGWVCGDKNRVSEEERASIKRRFHNGELLIVCNCDLWREGYNNPGVQLITLGTATKSLIRMIQWCGRGTRTLEGLIDGLNEKEQTQQRKDLIAGSGKPFLTVLDYAGNFGKHDVLSPIDIMAELAKPEAKKRAKLKAEKSGVPQDIAALLTEAEDELKRERELAEEARKAKLVAKATYSIEETDPFKRYNVRYQKSTSWDAQNGRIFSEKQSALLRERIGVNPAEISFSCGRQLIAAHFNRPATPAQQYTLKKHGYDPAKFTCKTASEMIHKIKNPVAA